MDIIYNPPEKDWPEIIKRPVFEEKKLLMKVQSIMNDVKQGGDQSVFKYSKKFDGVENVKLTISRNDINNSEKHIKADLKDAIDVAKKNIEKFHWAQQEKSQIIETSSGVNCWRKSVPIERVGLYVPGGSAPLFSSLLMLGIPAKLAGCHQIVVCTPPNKSGNVEEIILYTAKVIGLDLVYCIGGAQAIAAMTYGTETVPSVDKIFGPGNQYVTAAKQLAALHGVAIDMPAGPSEVAVLADDSAHPDFVASDLLSQAEHGPDSQVIFLTDSQKLLDAVLKELKQQLKDLPRKHIAEESLKSGKAILFDSINTAIDLVNIYASEHLIIATKNSIELSERVVSAGSVFIGNYSCESAGDYASGTNHTLPTNGYARNYSGVSLDSFYKKITFQEISETGIQNLGPVIEKLAEAESLHAHANAVKIRRRFLENRGKS
jgi:histidinol dehydrogenase